MGRICQRPRPLRRFRASSPKGRASGEEIKFVVLPRPLPLGEVALRSNDGEGKPGTKEPLRSDGQALCQSAAVAVPVLYL